MARFYAEERPWETGETGRSCRSLFGTNQRWGDSTHARAAYAKLLWAFRTALCAEADTARLEELSCSGASECAALKPSLSGKEVDNQHNFTRSA